MGLETILLAVDDNDRQRIEELTAAVADVAEPADADIVLAHVFSSDEYDRAKASLEFDANSEVTPTKAARRYVTVKEIAKALDEQNLGYEIQGSFSEGIPQGERIADLAEELDADLVIVGGRTRSPAGKALFGSTTQEVLLHAPCPVTFVRTE